MEKREQKAGSHRLTIKTLGSGGDQMGMRKLPMIAVLIAVLIMSVYAAAVIASDQTGPRIFLDGRQLIFDVQPEIINDRVMVPLRGVLEALGAQVSWHESTKTIIVVKDQTEIILTVNQNSASRNGDVIPLDTPPIIRKGRTLVPLWFIGETMGTTVEWEEKTKTVFINSLAVVGSYDKLKSLLAASQGWGPVLYKSMNLARSEISITATPRESSVPAAASAAAPSAEAASPDFSTTNVQVQGVDEADVIKTDGKYIYQVNNRRIVITRAHPAEIMRVESILTFDGEEFNPLEIYVDDKYLVVIGATYHRLPMPRPMPMPDIKPGAVVPEIHPPPTRVMDTIKVLIYDITDKANLKQVRNIELEGSYVSSRKIGAALYFVSNKYIDYYYIMRTEQAGEGTTPSFRDSAGTGEFQPVNLKDIHYFPGRIEPNYLIIAGLNLDKPHEQAKFSTYLGAGQNVYASQNNMYVAVTQYRQEASAEPAPSILPGAPSPTRVIAIPPQSQTSTTIYKFGLNDGRAVYSGKGEVPGTILNQFSMDEYSGYFRIATTKGDIWRTDEYTSKNNLYVLDEKLNITGKIEDIAPGERIYSARFMGDRAYMVTFKNVDPLFVIDLKDPQAPKILGALKIPGYSDYLHPYDENHIIGFGKDTIEISQKDWRGNDMGTMAYYQGMKLAIFDVTDITNPVEKFKENIGDRGTDSEMLRNHKALLFSREKNLLAFPVTLMEIKNPNPMENQFPQYGEFTFQGAYVYHVDMEKGFTLRGRITHMSEEEYRKAGRGWYYGNNNVERIFYIGDVLYTISKGMIKANDLKSLAELKSLPIPQ